MNNSKLALGTVQFGLQYGISNQNGIPDDQDLSAILTTASKLGIDTLDTAAAYGNSEERLGQHDLKKFNIVSKFPKGSDPKTEIDLSLSRLHLSQLYGYICHDIDDLLEFPQKWDELQQLKSERLVQKIGFSLYEPKQLENALSMGMVPDIVQFPFSILDRKFLPYLDGLKENNCEIHVRSAFLQGLYFMDPQKLPEKLTDLQKPLATIHRIAREAKKSIQELALAYVLAYHQIDKVVIGIETCDQLAKNIEAASGILSPAIKAELEHIAIARPELLNPAKW